MNHIVLAISFLFAQASLPLADDVDAQALQVHVKTLLRGLEKLHAPLPAKTMGELRPLLDKGPDDDVANALQMLLDARCLLGVSINPESRVKAARGPAAAELKLRQATYVLVKLHNEAGVTAALTLTGPQLAAPGKADAEHWLEAVVVTKAPFTEKLSGRHVEYVVIKLTAHEMGKREATFKFDVGQGTQDLGFRAEVPILFSVGK